MTEHPQRRLISVESGGFRLECPSGATIVITRENETDEKIMTVSGVSAIDGWRMLEERTGLRLERADGQTAGRSLRSPAGDATEEALSVLLDDGRLFRIAVAGPRDARFELRGWETRGAYFEARPVDDDWEFRTTAAGTGIDDAETLLLLFAAEVCRMSGTDE